VQPIRRNSYKYLFHPVIFTSVFTAVIFWQGNPTTIMEGAFPDEHIRIILPQHNLLLSQRPFEIDPVAIQCISSITLPFKVRFYIRYIFLKEYIPVKSFILRQRGRDQFGCLSLFGVGMHDHKPIQAYLEANELRSSLNNRLSCQSGGYIGSISILSPKFRSNANHNSIKVQCLKLERTKY